MLRGEHRSMHWGSAVRGPPLGHCSASLSQYYRWVNGKGERET